MEPCIPCDADFILGVGRVGCECCRQFRKSKETTGGNGGSVFVSTTNHFEIQVTVWSDLIFASYCVLQKKYYYYLFVVCCCYWFLFYFIFCNCTSKTIILYLQHGERNEIQWTDSYPPHHQDQGTNRQVRSKDPRIPDHPIVPKAAGERWKCQSGVLS